MRGYSYDYANQLTQVVSGTLTTQYAYNGDGVRTSKTVGDVTTQSVVDMVASLRVVISDTEAIYLYGLDIIAQQEAGARIYYVHDGLGSVRQLTDGSGEIAETYAYDPFGVPLSAGRVYNPFRFTGEAWNAEAELLYLRARYYQPATGRFLTRDPWTGDRERPATLDLYVYALNRTESPSRSAYGCGRTLRSACSPSTSSPSGPPETRERSPDTHAGHCDNQRTPWEAEMNGSTLWRRAFLLACGALIIMCACRESPPARTWLVNTYDLMVQVSDFPQGWQVCIGPLAPPEQAHGERGETEVLYVQFCPGGDESSAGATWHAVYRYRSTLDAARAFDLDLSGAEFPNLKEVIAPWALPEEWLYQSPIADRLRFACAEINILAPRWTCTGIAQYDEYISVFTTSLSPDNMTLDDVEQLLRSIDDRMAFYLEKDTE